jgi:hypothetical protein
MRSESETALNRVSEDAEARIAATDEALRVTQAQLDKYIELSATSERQLEIARVELAQAQAQSQSRENGDAVARESFSNDQEGKRHASQVPGASERVIDKVLELKAALGRETEKAMQLQETARLASIERDNGATLLQATQIKLAEALSELNLERQNKDLVDQSSKSKSESALQESLRILEADFERLSQKNMLLSSDLVEVKSACQGLEDRVASLLISVEERDCQLVALSDAAVALRKERDDALSRAAQVDLKRKLVCGERSPKEANVILRVKEEGVDTAANVDSAHWSLVRVQSVLPHSDTPSEDSLSPLNEVLWVRDEAVHAWNVIRAHHASILKGARSNPSPTKPKDSSFSIGDEDDDLERDLEVLAPLALPTALQVSAAKDKADAKQALESLRAGHTQSQSAFETYRDRSRATLVETLDKLKLSETLLQQERDAAAAATRASREREEQLVSSAAVAQRENEALLDKLRVNNSDLKAELDVERNRVSETQFSLEAARRELQAFSDAAELKALELKQQRDEQDKTAQESSSVSSSSTESHIAELEQRLVSQLQELEAAADRERRLVSDMKKKGDMARQLVASQEKDIANLRAKLQNLLNAASKPTVESQPARSGSGSGAHSVRFAPTSLEGASASEGLGLTLGEASGSAKTANSRQSNGTHSNSPPAAITEREQYLRQAFYGLFKAEAGRDMQHMCRAICAILQLTPEQCREISARVDVLAGAVSRNATMESLSSNISSSLTSLSSLWSK